MAPQKAWIVPIRARVDLVGLVAPAGLPQLLAELALEVGRGGVGIGDRGDVAQGEGLADSLPLDRHTEEVEDAADDGAGLAGARAGGNEDVLAVAGIAARWLGVGWSITSSPVLGPPGTRQISSAWQNGGQPQDFGGDAPGTRRERAVRTWVRRRPSAASSFSSASWSRDAAGRLLSNS